MIQLLPAARIRQTVCGLLLFALMGGTAAWAQTSTSDYDPTPETIQEIYSNKAAFYGRPVTLPAPVFVSTIDAASRDETRSYTVQDESGTGIQVFTPQALPEVNAEYQISGVVERGGSNTPYIFEQSRSECTFLSPCGGGGGLDRILLFAIVGLVVVVVGLGIYVMTQPEEEETPAGGTRGKGETDTVDVGSGGGQGGQGGRSGGQGINQGGNGAGGQGRGAQPPGMGGNGGGGFGPNGPGGVPGGGSRNTETVVMNLPPQKTVKMLGRLEFVNSDEDPIPLNVPIEGGPSSGNYYTFTIGRSDPQSGSDYSHIKLKPRTVSRQQAKLVYQEGSFYIVNLVSEKKNPTRVNDHQMGEGERRELSGDGDILQMGEVKLRFQQA